MRKHAPLLLCLFLLLPGPMTLARPVRRAQKIVTATQVNGTWRLRKNTFKILALGNQKLRVQFDGVFEYKSAAGPAANVGYGAGIATIEGDTAKFKPDDGEAECMITMRFVKGQMAVDQQGVCGFGHNVYATGAYRKISGRKPRFDVPGQ
ncbi:MAG: hypothetical protein ACKV2V_07030 [Blastocatellia bacterium]